MATTRDISPHEMVTGGTPSIYASEAEWAAYRQKQANDKALTNEMSAALLALTDIKRQENSVLPDTGAGAGRGAQGGASFEQAGSPDQSSVPSITPLIEALAASFTAGKDPLAADENGHNLTRTGQVNTTGAQERITGAAPKWYPGVTAVKQANGNLSLSNTQAPVVGGAMPNISNDLFSAINSLKTTNDVDVARGLLSTIRESAAQKSTEIMGEAMRFASTKLGVPALEQQLREAEVADRADPQWYPGIGDSPITAKIRAALLTTRSSVDNEAKNYLASNTSYASMNAALKTAEEEAKRITAIGDRTNRISDEMLLRDQLKKDAKVDEANALRATMSPEEQRRLIVLNPTLASIVDEGERSLAMAASIKRADRDANMRAALGATDMDLPILAMERNPDAVLLTVRKEQELNPAASDNEVQARIAEVSKIANGKDFIKLAVSQRFGGRVDSTEAKAYAAELNTSEVGLDAKGKALKRQEKYAMALDLYRRDATNRFAGDTTGWKVNDPEFLAAQEEAFKVTGKRDMDSVLTAYISSKAPGTQLSKLGTFRMLLSNASMLSAKSLFGTVDSIALDARIAGVAREAGVWNAILQSRTDSTFTFN
jgi:hypothetical protein